MRVGALGDDDRDPRPQGRAHGEDAGPMEEWDHDVRPGLVNRGAQDAQSSDIGPHRIDRPG